MSTKELDTRILQQQIRAVYSKYLETKQEGSQAKKELRSVEDENDRMQEKIDKLLDHAQKLKKKKETLMEENFKLGLSICQSKIEKGKTRCRERKYERNRSYYRRRSSSSGSVKQFLNVFKSPFKKNKNEKKRERQRSIDEGRICKKYVDRCMTLSKEVKLVKTSFLELRRDVLDIFSRASDMMEDDILRVVYCRSNHGDGEDFDGTDDISDEVAYYEEFKRLRDLKEENEMKFALRCKELLEGLGIIDFPYSKVRVL